MERDGKRHRGADASVFIIGDEGSHTFRQVMKPDGDHGNEAEPEQVVVFTAQRIVFRFMRNQSVEHGGQQYAGNEKNNRPDQPYLFTADRREIGFTVRPQIMKGDADHHAGSQAERSGNQPFIFVFDDIDDDRASQRGQSGRS